MIHLNTLKTINGLEIKARSGPEFKRIRRVQPRDPISCRYVVFSGNIGMGEFRRYQSAVKFCKQQGEPSGQDKAFLEQVKQLMQTARLALEEANSYAENIGHRGTKIYARQIVSQI